MQLLARLPGFLQRLRRSQPLLCLANLLLRLLQIDSLGRLYLIDQHRHMVVQYLYKPAPHDVVPGLTDLPAAA
jgi:hypothetical protein